MFSACMSRCVTREKDMQVRGKEGREDESKWDITRRGMHIYILKKLPCYPALCRTIVVFDVLLFSRSEKVEGILDGLFSENRLPGLFVYIYIYINYLYIVCDCTGVYIGPSIHPILAFVEVLGRY